MAAGPHREGYLLVVEEGAEMPLRCPKCNESAVEEPMPVRFVANRGRGLGQKAVVAATHFLRGWNYTGPVEVNVYFCARHRARKQQFAIAFVMMIVLGGLMWGLAVSTARAPFKELGPAEKGFQIVSFLVAAIGFLAGTHLLGGHFSPWRFIPKHFDDRTVRVAGACDAFLDSLPSHGAAGTATKKAA